MPSSSPSREKEPRQPFSHTASPHRQTTLPTASSSTTSLPTAVNPTLYTIESIIALHSSAADPKLAALDQALSERNVLSSQNTQLWKLIEKQRSGYNQIMKELERVRNERDTYKARLASATGRHTSKERTPKQSMDSDSDHITPRSSSRLAPLTVPPRSDNLPELSATQETPPQSFNNNVTPKYSHFAHGYNDSIMSSLSYTSSSKASTRKSSFTESISSVSTSDTDGNVYGGIAPARYDYPSPQTAPAEFSINHLHTPLTPHPPQIITELSTPTAPDRHISPTSNKPNNNLTALSPAMRAPLSRESRISLPDEAKQYIASMGESPVPSPRVENFNKAPSSLSQSFVPVSPGPGKDQEFLDLDEEDDNDNDDDDDEGNEGDGDGPEDDYEVVNPSSASSSTSVTPSAPSESSQDQVQLGTSSSASSSPLTQTPVRSSSSHSHVAGANEFPLPSSTMTPHHAEARAEAAYQRQLVSENPPPWPNDETRPQRLDTQNLPPPSTNAAISPAGFFRALPLLPTDLPHTKINVSQSFVRPNDRGKEVLSFVVYVDPGKGKEGWKVEKMYSDVLNLDQRVRGSVGKTIGKKIVTLPEGKLWKDHAPAKADQRKAVLETYLQSLINLPVKSNDEVIAFFTTDIVKDAMQPVMQAGYKEGYLTKRGKNFGGWKTRYFVLQGPVLEYFDCRGGTHLGSITVSGAQIGRQQRSNNSASTDEEKEYRHAFLIVEAKKGPGGNHPRHVLCAESDIERDSWVEILVRYFTGTYSEEPVAYAPTSTAPTQYSNGASQPSAAAPRTSVSADPPRKPSRGFSKDDISAEKRSAPLSQMPPDVSNPKLFPRSSQDDYSYSSSPSKPILVPAPDDFRASERAQQGQPSSLPDSSPLSNPPPFDADQRSNSEMGHYPDIQTVRAQRQSPELHRHRGGDLSKQTYGSHSSPVRTSPSERVPSPEKMEKVKISGPMNGAPIPAGYKFGNAPPPPEATLVPPTSGDRREKAKSRSFWGFSRPGGSGAGSDKNTPVPSASFAPRAVFGVNLEESLDVAQIANLPAIVFRCIQYLEAKKADQEEGIYRLSGSSAVIKSLKDRFNFEGDVDLLASDEFWDPHAIAGLLKGFLRELPSSILTRELHMRFLAVIDFVDPQERIKELSQLIASLPIANYSLLRALTAHLILIVQNSSVNKMTMRNVGIVFSPTLGIPAGVFSLMLGEFNRVFNVDAAPLESAEDPEETSDRRNSMQYSEAAADKLLGLGGRSLSTPAEEAQSDTDEYSIHEESGTEPDVTVEESSDTGGSQQGPSPPDTPMANNKATRASNVAAGRGLNISVSDRGHRYSRMMGGPGLPTSPRPPPSPSPAAGRSSSASSPVPAQ
ncbi:hypothetical protein BDP27DRAFT_1413038 [Rhodocollybia butyracea]|uniref:RhoGAP-domain-containing protein n=1 Tax=Rhodocollybia butyracea TaxID=206335 RepID=A0A9P5UGY0_9AGAR|nr:hypothetical protein BDP27DRAFT_1413038 [Rhodocollybia butyracea]